MKYIQYEHYVSGVFLYKYSCLKRRPKTKFYICHLPRYQKSDTSMITLWLIYFLQAESKQGRLSDWCHCQCVKYFEYAWRICCSCVFGYPLIPVKISEYYCCASDQEYAHYHLSCAISLWFFWFSLFYVFHQNIFAPMPYLSSTNYWPCFVGNPVSHTT